MSQGYRHAQNSAYGKPNTNRGLTEALNNVDDKIPCGMILGCGAPVKYRVKCHRDYPGDDRNQCPAYASRYKVSAHPEISPNCFFWKEAYFY